MVGQRPIGLAFGHGEIAYADEVLQAVLVFQKCEHGRSHPSMDEGWHAAAWQSWQQASIGKGCILGNEFRSGVEKGAGVFDEFGSRQIKRSGGM